MIGIIAGHMPTWPNSLFQKYIAHSAPTMVPRTAPSATRASHGASWTVARSGYAIRRRKEVRKLGFHSSTCLKFMNQDNGPAFIVLLWAFLFNFACVLLFTTWVSTFKARGPERWKHVWPIQLAVTL